MIMPGSKARERSMVKVEYKFMIWAGDGEPDTFRIKIWEEVDGVETVIYDNGMDQPIEGGNIVVHTKIEI